MSELGNTSENSLIKREIRFDPHEIATTLNSHAEPWNLVKDKSLPIPVEKREGLSCILLRGVGSETLLYLHPGLKLVVVNLRSKDEEHIPLGLYFLDEVTKIHVVEPDESRPEKSISIDSKKGSELVIFESGRYRVDDTSKRKKLLPF